MNIVAQNTANEQVSGTISCFVKNYGIRDLLEKCNARKEKGVAVLSIFLYLLQNVFADRSMYMQQKTERYQESFSKKCLLPISKQREDELATVHNAVVSKNHQRDASAFDR